MKIPRFKPVKTWEGWRLNIPAAFSANGKTVPGDKGGTSLTAVKVEVLISVKESHHHRHPSSIFKIIDASDLSQ